MDAQTAVKNLIALGWRETRIAELVGVTQPSINRIKAGTQQPAYSVGAAIVALAKSRRKPA